MVASNKGMPLKEDDTAADESARVGRLTVSETTGNDVQMQVDELREQPIGYFEVRKAEVSQGQVQRRGNDRERGELLNGHFSLGDDSGGAMIPAQSRAYVWVATRAFRDTRYEIRDTRYEICPGFEGEVR